MAKTYVIADLHGRYDLLLKAIDLIECEEHFNEGITKLVILGDFVDRGPQSRQIIDHLMFLQKDPGYDLTVLQGNHEAIMLRAVTNPAKHLDWWAMNGGLVTLRSYGIDVNDTTFPIPVPEEHIRWLYKLPISHEDKHRIYVHAGLPHNELADKASWETMQWMLYGQTEIDDGIYEPNDPPHISGKHIVHGHEQDMTHPLELRHRTNLDAFAFLSGRLAIGVFDDDKPGGPEKILWAHGEPL